MQCVIMPAFIRKNSNKACLIGLSSSVVFSKMYWKKSHVCKINFHTFMLHNYPNDGQRVDGKKVDGEHADDGNQHFRHFSPRF